MITGLYRYRDSDNLHIVHAGSKRQSSQDQFMRPYMFGLKMGIWESHESIIYVMYDISIIKVSYVPYHSIAHVMGLI